jgi:hypothetical protein
MRLRIYGDVLPGAVIWCASDRALAINEGLGHEWNRAMAISGAMHGGHVSGAF